MLIRLNFAGREGFIKAVQQCDIVALECLWVPASFRVLEGESFLRFYDASLTTLRNALSAKVRCLNAIFLVLRCVTTEHPSGSP